MSAHQSGRGGAMRGYYRRPDRLRRWSKHPGTYGLYLTTPGRAFTPEDMMISANDVESLIRYRRFYKSDLWAVIQRAERIPAFEEVGL